MQLLKYYNTNICTSRRLILLPLTVIKFISAAAGGPELCVYGRSPATRRSARAEARFAARARPPAEPRLHGQGAPAPQSAGANGFSIKASENNRKQIVIVGVLKCLRANAVRLICYLEVVEVVIIRSEISPVSRTTRYFGWCK